MVISNIPLNPIARIRKSLGMYQNGFAKACDLSDASIYYVEKGQFANIPEGIHTFMERSEWEYDRNAIEAEYYNWIRKKRYSYGRLLPSIIGIPNKPEDLNGKHPLVFYVDYVKINPSKFTDWMCIPKNTYYAYVGGSQRKLPEIIRTAFYDAGFDDNEVDFLDNLGAAFYSYAERTRIVKRRHNDRKRTG